MSLSAQRHGITQLRHFNALIVWRGDRFGSRPLASPRDLPSADRRPVAEHGEFAQRAES